MLTFNLLFIAIIFAAAIQHNVHSFTPIRTACIVGQSVLSLKLGHPKSLLKAEMNDDGGDNNSAVYLSLLNESDQIFVGVIGTSMALVMLYSEFVLKTTGCGLPAGPYGLIGAIEGISYLGVTTLTGFSLLTKVRTGSGLPAGPRGILGLAEGLSFLAITIGIVVLLFQIIDKGYIPNALPYEGSICK